MTPKTGTPPNAAREPERRAWSVAMVDRLLRPRATAAALLAAAVAYVLPGFLAGFYIHRCPFHILTGLPCPGCGLSRALRLMASGEFEAMWTMHPFAPYMLVLGIMLAGAVLLPSRWRERWVAGWTALEARTSLHAVVLTGFAVFGIARLLWRIAQR